MGNVILCMGSSAKTPYLLKALGIRITTIEELCYCIRENTFLMERELTAGELIKWLREECELSELADSLQTLSKARASADAFAGQLLEYTGYYPQAEIKRIVQFLKTGAGQSEAERKKSAADYLVGNGKYKSALKQYLALFEELPEEETQLRGKVSHNIGCVYARLFLFEKAADFFKTAYELTKEPESLLQFLAAKRMELPEKEYVDFVVKLSAKEQQLSMELEKRIEKRMAAWKESAQARELFAICMQRGEQEGIYQDALMSMTERMKETYRNMV